ncbi:amino acid ABC transporter ATP-binding/permease protein [Gemmiger sp.]
MENKRTRGNFNVMYRLVGLVRPLAPVMVCAVLLGVAGFLCAIFIPVLGVYALLDSLHFSVPVVLKTACILLPILAVARGVLHYAEQGCNHFIAFKLLALIRDKVFGVLRQLAPAKLEGRDKGDLIAVLTADIELLEVFYAHTISPICIAVIVSVVMACFMGSYAPALGLYAALAYAVIGIGIPVAAARGARKSGESFRAEFGALNGFVLDSLRGVRESLQYNDGAHRLAQINQRTDALAGQERRLKEAGGTAQAVTGAIIQLLDAGMLALAGSLFMAGAIGFDGALVSVVALMSSFGPVIALANLGTGLQSTFAAGNRVLDILDEQPAVREVTDGRDIVFRGADARRVTFGYRDSEILKEVSLHIPEHGIVGITGRSGSGKSTLLKLLMRFWDTDLGRVEISGENIKGINTASLRAAESFVEQDTVLFHDSIEENVKIANRNATHEQVMAACRKASIHDFIMTLPQGYDTPVGELGYTLSGGERQRLGVARAFLHDAPFILLDEPTSNLDSLNEAVILRSLAEERASKTVVLVSHRASTMRIADTTYSVENGRMS